VDPSYIFVGALTACWLALLPRPKWYVRALFLTAPWMGLWVKAVWMVDPFKIGLILAPLLLISAGRLRPIRGLATPLMLLAGYLGMLFAWQLVSGEVSAMDDLQHLDANGRLAVATGMQLLRIAAAVVIIKFTATIEEAKRCADSYVLSVTILSVYGLAQETTFLLTGSPITPMNFYGLFEGGGSWFTMNVFGIDFARLYAFCGEPKDFALVLVPAIAYVYAAGRRRAVLGSRWWRQKIQLAVLITATLLTFSSSVLLLAPLLLLAVETAINRNAIGGAMRRAFVVLPVILILLPALGAFWTLRVTERFKQPEDLLQESRERPAAEFFLDHIPRVLLGYGVGTQALYLPAYMPAEYKYRMLDYQGAAGVDSFWFTVVLDLGVPGALLYLWCLREAFRSSRRAIRVTSPFRAALVTLVFAGIPLAVELRSAVLWLFLALAYRVGQLTNEGPAMESVRIVPLQAPAAACTR
jgi:hypothetical protein